MAVNPLLVGHGPLSHVSGRMAVNPLLVGHGPAGEWFVIAQY
jgi:DNA-binding MltR family transcriptional regulator